MPVAAKRSAYIHLAISPNISVSVHFYIFFKYFYMFRFSLARWCSLHQLPKTNPKKKQCHQCLNITDQTPGNPIDPYPLRQADLVPRHVALHVVHRALVHAGTSRPVQRARRRRDRNAVLVEPEISGRPDYNIYNDKNFIQCNIYQYI